MTRFEAGLLDWFRTRESALLAEIRVRGEIADAQALESKIAAFLDRFEPTAAEPGPEPEPDEEPQGRALASMVNSDTTLPEAHITRTDGEG